MVGAIPGGNPSLRTPASLPPSLRVGLSSSAVFMPPLYRAGRLVSTSNEPPEVREYESLSALSLHPRLPADDALHDARHAWAALPRRPRPRSLRRAGRAASGSEPDLCLLYTS